MKIAYCIPSLETSGGTERIVIEKINYLVNNDYEIIIITTEGNRKTPFFYLSPKVRIIELNINFNEDINHILPVKFLKTKRKLNRYKKELSTFIQQESIDIVISTGAKELEFLHSLRVRCKKICELHFSKDYRKQAYLSRNSNLLWKMVGDFRTATLIKQTKNLDRLIVLTRQDEKQWKETNNNITQIYNFSAFESDVIADLNEKCVIAVGRLSEQKGFDMLIDAWSIVAEKNKDWKLKIFGTGILENELKQQVKQLRIENFVNFEGQTNAVAEKILQSSIFALSSRYEGFPLVLLESITCGVPIVSFDCKTGPNEVITENDCGILVENGNVQKFAESLLVLMNDLELRQLMGKKAKDKSEVFSKQFIMNQWTMLFDELMKIKK